MFRKKCTCFKTRDISFDLVQNDIDGYKMKNKTLSECSFLFYGRKYRMPVNGFFSEMRCKDYTIYIAYKAILIYHHLLIEGSEKEF